MVHLSSLLDNVPIPSYAQEKLFLEYEPFLAALTPILKRNLHPKGPVVASTPGVSSNSGCFSNNRPLRLAHD